MLHRDKGFNRQRSTATCRNGTHVTERVGDNPPLAQCSYAPSHCRDKLTKTYGDKAARAVRLDVRCRRGAESLKNLGAGCRS